jgi:formylglycine-generating enzyme required for sulfatase activity
MIVLISAGSVPARPTRPLIVDWGHDWGSGWFRQQADQDANSAWRPIAEEDANGNGTTEDDQIRGWPLDTETPLSPRNLVYDYTYPSARFYGAGFVLVTDLPPREDGNGFVQVSAPSEGHINQNHELRDDWNLMSMPAIKRQPEVSRYAANLLVFWDKADFLNNGNRQRVSFDDESYLGVFISRYWGGVHWGRWVVRNQGTFYISEATFAGQTESFDLTETSPFNGARNPVVRTTHVVVPAATRWAVYHPEAPHRISFNPETAVFLQPEFTDVDAVGFLAQRDLAVGQPVAGGLWDLPHGLGEPVALKFNAVQVRAQVENPSGDSPHLPLSFPDGPEGPAVSEGPVRYAEWVRVWRGAVSNQRASRFTEAHADQEIGGYGFLQDGLPGAIATGRIPAVGTDEPVTMVAWHDAILWCNALSELEGREPAYYSDAGHREPLRAVMDRSKLEQRDHRPVVYWKHEANGYRLPTLAERAARTDTPVPGIAAEWVWDAAGPIDDPASRPERTAWEGAPRSPENPTLMPFGEQPAEGTYDLGFSVVRGPAGALPVADTTPSVRRLATGVTVVPAEPFTTERLREIVARLSEGISVPGAGGLPDNDVITREYRETGRYDLVFARTETSYALWNLVRQWASMQRGYRFNYPGDPGNLHYLAGDGAGKRHLREEPVTRIDWLDAVVWCNALSELLGREPVYRIKTTGEPLRDAGTFRVAMYPEYAYPNTGRYANRPLDTAAVIDLSVQTSGNGFRLPTLAEWEVARDAAPDPGAGWTAEHAGGRTHPVETRTASARGLHDLEGNVQEMTYGGDALFGQNRAGNSFADPAGHYPHPMTRKEIPGVGRSFVGFRVVSRTDESVPTTPESRP